MRCPAPTLLTGDQEETSSELLEDNNSLALVDASKDDGDGTGSEAGPQRPGVLAEEVLRGSLRRTERQNEAKSEPERGQARKKLGAMKKSEHEKLHL